PAELFVYGGAHYVVPDFAWVQDVGGSLIPMAEQVRRAVAWVYHNAQHFGGDPNRIYVSGHSSGGHLAGVLLTTDWPKEFNLPRDIIKGGLCISGMFDLKPVRLSARSSYVKFTDEMEHALSPQRHLDKLTAPVIIAYATLDSPEFQRQSRDFAAAVQAASKSVQLLVAEGYNHVEAPETLGNPYGLLGRAVLEQMRLAKMWHVCSCTRREETTRLWVSPGHVSPFTSRRCGMHHHSQPLMSSLTRRRLLRGALGSVAGLATWQQSWQRYFTVSAQPRTPRGQMT